MTPQEVEALLAKPLNAIVAVNRRSGGPQLTPVWFLWDGSRFAFSTTRDRVKYGNIRRDPNISLIVDDLAAHQYVVAYGRAEILEGSPEDIVRPLMEKYIPGNEARIDAVLRDPSRITVVMRPESLISR